MRHLYLIVLMAFAMLLPEAAFAQEENWPAPCGTPGYRSEWLKSFQQRPVASSRNSDTVLYVPLTIHLLGNDAGEGYFSVRRLKEAFCKLNDDFAPANIQFFLAGDIRYLPNSEYNVHESVLDGAEMMFANNVANTLNIYFCDSPAGNCGYNLPYAGIAMNESCSGPNSDTWAHEIGHALSVQHPFLGWEGGVSYDGSINHNYNDPAPETVLYDYTNFKDTLILDTTIIDTAIVELVDGSNCTVAGDGFCDTSPDYLGFRWNCNADGESPTLQTDPTGATFRSDGTLIMGYANDGCQNRFTPEQVAAMRANLYEEKPELISPHAPPPPLAAEGPLQLLPEDGGMAQYDNAAFSWEPVEGAEFYILEISLLPTMSSLVEEYVTPEPTLTLSNLQEGSTYYWRVSAFSRYSFCTERSERFSFDAMQVVQTEELPGLTEAALFPNPAEGQTALRLTLEQPQPAVLSLYSASGQEVYRSAAELQSGSQQLNIPLGGLPAGLYELVLRTPQGQLNRKISVLP